jgi:hypothetical protein
VPSRGAACATPGSSSGSSSSGAGVMYLCSPSCLHVAAHHPCMTSVVERCPVQVPCHAPSWSPCCVGRSGWLLWMVCWQPASGGLLDPANPLVCFSSCGGVSAVTGQLFEIRWSHMQQHHACLRRGGALSWAVLAAANQQELEAEWCCEHAGVVPCVSVGTCLLAMGVGQALAASCAPGSAP